MDDARVGAQLRAARLAARKSMAEVAEEAGLTKGFLSKLERDLANVSVASLIRLCDALGVSVGSLFQPSKGEVVRAERAADDQLRRQGDVGVPAHAGPRAADAGDPVRHRARRRQRRRAVRAAGRRGARVHHGRTARDHLDEEVVVLEEGDAFTFTANARHAFRAVGESGPTRVLWVVSPALPDTTRYP